MASIEGIREELTEAIKGEYPTGFRFSCAEGPGGVQAALSNGALSGVLALPDGEDGLVLEYGLWRPEGGASQTYRSELVRVGDSLAFRRSDLSSGRVLEEVPLPPAHHDPLHDENEFETLADCIAAFEGSDYQLELQAKANETCRTQFGHLHCCLKTGACYSVVVTVRPTTWRCLVTVAYDGAEVFAPIGG
jgi:hypothetical protein